MLCAAASVQAIEAAAQSGCQTGIFAACVVGLFLHFVLLNNITCSKTVVPLHKLLLLYAGVVNSFVSKGCLALVTDCLGKAWRTSEGKGNQKGASLHLAKHCHKLSELPLWQSVY